LEIWDRLKAKQDDELKSKPREKIMVQLPQGDPKEAVSWQTTPLEIARSLSKSLAERIVIAEVHTISPFSLYHFQKTRKKKKGGLKKKKMT
jgi:threonyl-tRNA synthetase